MKNEILKHNPDVIALQESPSESWGNDTFAPAGYRSCGTARSHCFLNPVDLLIKMSIVSDGSFQSIALGNLPAVAVTVTLACGMDISIASCHLAPFGDAEAAPIRLHQMTHLIHQIPTAEYVILGDMNMRQAEDKNVEALGLTEAWKVAGTKENKFTWNSIENKYHGDAFGFSCRFDRVYFHGQHISVNMFDLMGNSPVGGRDAHYLSDHYGIVSNVTVGSNSNVNDDTGKVARVRVEENKERRVNDKKKASAATKSADSAGYLMKRQARKAVIKDSKVAQTKPAPKLKSSKDDDSDGLWGDSD